MTNTPAKRFLIAVLIFGILGALMVLLSVAAFFSSNEPFSKLSAYACLVFLLLAFATVAVALWSGA